MGRPLVSVCILSYNRRDDLAFTLKQLQRDPYGALELLVADNASEDGTQAMLARDFPEVKLFAHPHNLGIEALNAPFRAAAGEIILVLDDDAWPEPGAIGAAVARFAARPEVGLIAADIIEPGSARRWDMAYLPRRAGTRPRPWHCFVGCGFFIRAELLRAIGGYPKGFFLYANEAPMAAEVFLRGFDIEFLPQARVFHKMPSRQQGFSLPHVFYGLRNDLQTAWRYYHGWRYYDILLGRLVTGFILLALLGRGARGAYARVLRDLRSYQRCTERRPLPERAMRRGVAAFHGTTLTTLLSYRTLRRVLWYVGFYKDGRVVS
jgi:GT2 family glycosyltransferase